MILALPILTRLFSPDDFALLAIFVSLLGLISVVACLRLDIAIPIPKEDGEALDLLVLALVSSLLFGGIIGLLCFFFAGDVAHVFGRDEIEKYIWLLPLGVLGAGGYAAAQFWATRKKNFKDIAKTHVKRSLAGTGVQLAGGLLAAGPIGLVLGYIVTQIGGAVSLGVKAFSDIRCLGYRPSSRIFLTLKSYKRFPLYSTWESLFNSAAIQLPVILIAAFIAGPEVGYLMLAMRVMAAPMSLLGGSVAQVYLSQAPEKYRDGELGAFTASLIVRLLIVGGPVIFIGGLGSPWLFPWVFGAEWERAGIFVLWMVPWFILQFITSPVSMALHVVGMQHVSLLLQVFGFLVRCGAVLLAFFINESFLVSAYVASGAVFYFVYLVVVLRVIRVSFGEVLACAFGRR